MFAFTDLQVPIVAAPMAGGPSTPELVAAVSAAGGAGFLAAGYLAADALAERIAATRSRTERPFGVNVFVPGADPDPGDLLALAEYREQVAAVAERFDADVPDPRPDDDGWDAKIDLLLADPVAVVSFTFGLPPAETVRALRAVGTCTVATVASARDARAAVDRGVDTLCVQGPEAGGHRATLTAGAEPGDEPLPDLLAAVRAETDLPLVAAGGIAAPEDVRAALDAGAVAAQVGTALLRTPEAGTSPTHRVALADPAYERTVVTRAFSGRPARGLDNAFVRTFDAAAPAVYPQVDQVTKPLRKAAAAAGDPRWVHLWAGTSWRRSREEPAADVIRRLAG